MLTSFSSNSLQQDRVRAGRRAAAAIFSPAEHFVTGHVDVPWWVSLFTYNGARGSGSSPYVTGHINVMFPWARVGKDEFKWLGSRKVVGSFPDGMNCVPLLWNYLGKSYPMKAWAGSLCCCISEDGCEVAPATCVGFTIDAPEDKKSPEEELDDAAPKVSAYHCSLGPMEKHIRLQGYTKPAAQVKELTLNSCDLSSTSFEALKAYHVLEELKIIYCNVKSLETFPSLPLLKVLELFGNHISSLAPLSNVQLKNLETLDLSCNSISSFDELKHIAKFPTIKSIKIDGNLVADESDTREKLFALLPKLKFIDDVDREGNKVDGSGSSASSASEDEENKSSSGSGSGSGSGSQSSSGSEDVSEGSGSEESDEELGTRTLLQDDYESESDEADFVPGAGQEEESASGSESGSESAAEDDDVSASESGSASQSESRESGSLSEDSSEGEDEDDEEGDEDSGSDADAAPPKKQKL
jgi:acidic leucine-rich nuclear phosphoprotein 32 family protein B